MIPAFLFTMIVCPMMCFGLRASAESACRKWRPELSVEDRAEMIRIPSRAFIRVVSVGVFLYACACRALSRPSLTTEFVYVGSVAMSDVFYAWDDSDVKPHWERLGMAFSVYVLALYVWKDGYILHFAMGYTFFGTVWALLQDAETLHVDVYKAPIALRVLEITTLGIVLWRPAYELGIFSPFMILFALFIVRGSRLPWYI